MSYYWRIKWRDYNEQELLITDKQAQIINQNLVLENRPERFTLNSIPYRYDAIDVVEPTTKKVEEDTSLLGSGDTKLESGPVVDQEGSVVTNWYKKQVTSKEYESYYGKHHGYYLLSRDANEIWIAIRVPEEFNKEKNPELELCSQGEADRLWKNIEIH